MLIIVWEYVIHADDMISVVPNDPENPKLAPIKTVLSEESVDRRSVARVWLRVPNTTIASILS